MRKFFRFFSWQKIVLFLILSLVVYKSRLGNGQWLLGWDSVVPELDFKLNFTRAIAGAWQEYQGLGLAGGMAHLSDLTRIAILWILHFVIPANQLRWVWHMTMLAIGPIGLWWMGKRLWKWSESASLSASIFYLLNLATIQYFFVPYEAFSSFYGFLPWLIGTFLMYLESGKARDLWKILLVGILATSAFYVQTLFIVYCLIIGFLSLGYLKHFKRVLIGLLTIMAINSFWLLPLLYGLWQGASFVGIAKINRIGSTETALMNEGFGGWKNVSLMRGYWLQYIELIGTDKWGRLMSVWYSWTDQKYIEIAGLILFGMSIVGTVSGIFTKKIKLVWIVVFGFGFMMLSSFNPPLGFIYTWMVQNIPLFGEIFRSVFTKWSVAFALFIGIGIGTFANHLKNKWLGGFLALLIIGGSIFVAWPVFGNGIVFEKMKVEIPGPYTNLFSFMNGKTNEVGRIAYLPADNMWSWKYSDWGYRGSGFLWYGMNQPILDRAFDVWSPHNETLYDQFSTALYGGSKDDIGHVLAQYDVKYVLLDESIIVPGQGLSILRIPETKQFMHDLGATQIFQDHFLTLWEIGKGSEKFVSTPSHYSFASGETSYTRKDVVSGDVGSYINDKSLNQKDASYYPLASLMKEEIKGVEYGSDHVTIKQNIPRELNDLNHKLVVPAFKKGEKIVVNYAVSLINGVNQVNFLPTYQVDGQDGPKIPRSILSQKFGSSGSLTLVVGEPISEVGKNYAPNMWSEYLKDQEFRISSDQINVVVGGAPIVYDFEKLGKQNSHNCDVLNRGTASKQGSTYIADQYGAQCDYVLMTDTNTELSYLMRVKGENKKGLSLKTYFYNERSGRNDSEYLLGTQQFDQTFPILSWGFSSKYSFNIVTRSFGQRAENKLDPIEVRYFPLRELASAKIIGNSVSPLTNKLKVVEVKKWGTWLYQVKVEGSGLLKLSQGYDEGWISLGLKHVEVDGWANGWMIPGSGVATIFYWPQLLEYLGFIALGSTVLILIFKRK